MIGTGPARQSTDAARRCVVLLGPPGAGKGTQAAHLARRHGYAWIASGVLLREHVAQGTALGVEADGYMRAGELVPDQLVTAMVIGAVRNVDSPDLVLDGYPKSRAQALTLDQVLDELGFGPRLAVLLRVGQRTLQERLLARGRESGRLDDTPDVIARRLALLGTPPLDMLAHYDKAGQLETVDGERLADEVSSLLDRATATRFARCRHEENRCELE